MPVERKVPRPFTMHWGGGEITEEATFAGEWNEPTIQLMEYRDGDVAGSWSVRFCSFTHRGQFQRSPLLLHSNDIDEMRDALKRTPQLRAILKRLVE